MKNLYIMFIYQNYQSNNQRVKYFVKADSIKSIPVPKDSVTSL